MTPQEMADAYTAGATIRQLAAATGLNARTVRRRVLVGGATLRPRGRRMTQVDPEQLDQLLTGGASQTATAAELGVSRTVVRRASGHRSRPRRQLEPAEAAEIRDLTAACQRDRRGDLALDTAAGQDLLVRAAELADLGVPLAEISRAAGYSADWLRRRLDRGKIPTDFDTERALAIEWRLHDRAHGLLDRRLLELNAGKSSVIKLDPPTADQRVDDPPEASTAPPGGPH